MRAWPRGGLWRHGDFLRLWGAQTISQFGSQISGIGLPLVAIIALDASAFEVALVPAVEFAPFLLVALPAGVWVDRLRRKPILVLADVARGVALATIPVAWALDVLTIWQLYVVGLVVGVFTVFFDVAYQSYLPSLVGRHELIDGNSKLEVSRSAAQIGGPGIGGLLVQAITAPYAVAVDAVSFVWSAWFLGRIRRAEEPVVQTESRSMRRELAEGLRYLLGDPRWRAIALNVGWFNFWGNVMYSIFLVYAVRELGLTAATIGVIFALGNVGWLFGAVAAGRFSARLGIGRALIVSGILSGAGNLLIPLAPQSSAVPFFVASGALAALGIVLYNVNAISLMQALVPERMLGRMNASRRWIVWGVIPLGNIVGGVLATTIGLRETLFVGAVMSASSFLFLLAKPLRTIERLPEPTQLPPPVPPVGATLEHRPVET